MTPLGACSPKAPLLTLPHPGTECSSREGCCRRISTTASPAILAALLPILLFVNHKKGPKISAQLGAPFPISKELALGPWGSSRRSRCEAGTSSLRVFLVGGCRMVKCPLPTPPGLNRGMEELLVSDVHFGSGPGCCPLTHAFCFGNVYLNVVFQCLASQREAFKAGANVQCMKAG